MIAQPVVSRVLSEVRGAGEWALVTGASSGLGEHFCRALATQGLDLVLVARRGDRLRQLAEQLAAEVGIRTRVLEIDLGRPDACETVLQGVADIEVGLLVCNAGATRTGPMLERNATEVLANFDLNARSVLALCHHFGGRMAARRRGGLILVSSIVAFAGVPGWSVYAAAKAFDVTLALGLGEELRRQGVAVQALCPGHVRTEFHAEAGIRALWPLAPEAVVRTSLGALDRRRLLVPGLFNKLCVFGLRLLPRPLGTRVYGWVLQGLRRSAG